MTTQSPPIVSLQAPKDVSIDVIEQELRDIWQSYNKNEDGESDELNWGDWNMADDEDERV